MSFSPFSRRSDPTVEHRIQHALDDIPGVLRTEMIIVELVEFVHESGTAVLRLRGDCPDCDMTAAMYVPGIEAHLRMQVPEIRAVRVSGEVAS
jgi:Fe-S cluster biogenesis protein NfuA